MPFQFVNSSLLFVESFLEIYLQMFSSIIFAMLFRSSYSVNTKLPTLAFLFINFSLNIFCLYLQFILYLFLISLCSILHFYPCPGSNFSYLLWHSFFFLIHFFPELCQLVFCLLYSTHPPFSELLFLCFILFSLETIASLHFFLI